MHDTDPAARRLDTTVAAALFAATLIYLYFWPLDFYWFDEGLFLYEAKRIRDGQIIYRDFFEIVTPAAWYLMALAFAIFGATIETARAIMAVTHGATIALLYAASRAVGARRVLAAAAALAYLALCHPSLPNASPHWFSTCLSVLLLLILLRRPWAARASGAGVPGLLAGALVLVQQQRAVAVAGGALLVLLLDCGIDRRYGRPASSRLLARLAWFVAGGAAVVMPAAVALVALVGVRPLVEGLIEFPLYYYRGYHHNMVWGYYVPWIRPIYGRPELIKHMYVLLPILSLRAAMLWMRRRDADQVGWLLTELVIATCAIASIAYNPNYTHLTFIAAVFFVPLAHIAEWLLALAPPDRAWWRRATAGAAAALLIVTVAEACRSLIQRRTIFDTPYETPFGHVDLRDSRNVALLDKLGELLPAAPNRDLFCYPNCAGLYLMSDTVNPTRFQILMPNYSSPEQIRQALDTLETRKVPYVVILPIWVRWSTDPVVKYVRQHYRRVALGPRTAAAIALFERKPERAAQP